MNYFDVTFERVTPESAEHGEADSNGYAVENATLREALDLIGDGHYCEVDSWPCDRPRWLTFYNTNDGTIDYFETGATENLSLHIPGTVTRASARRIAKLCGASL